MHIVNNSSSERAFDGLFERSSIPKLADGITKAIDKSFAPEQDRVSRNEVRRRMDICVRIIRELRGDLSWSIDHILDNLPRYLKCELDGVSWEPEDRKVWLPSG